MTYRIATTILIIITYALNVKAEVFVQAKSLNDFEIYYQEQDFTKKAELLESLLNNGLDENEFDLFQMEVEKIFDYAKRMDDSFLLNYCRFLYSYVLIETLRINESLSMLKRCKEYFLNKDNFRILGEIERKEGICESKIGKFESSLLSFKHSQRYFKECNMHMEYIHSRALEAKILMHYKEYTKAKHILNGCIVQMKKYDKNKTIFGYYNFLSDLYSETGNIEMVKYCNLKSVEFAVKSGDLNTIALSKNNLGIAEFYEGQIENSLMYFRQALEKRKLMNKTKLISESYYNIATVYFSSGSNEEAIVYFNKALNIALENNFSQEKADGFLALSEVYEMNKDFVKALEMNKMYLKVKEEIYTDGIKNAKDMSFKLSNFEMDEMKSKIIESRESNHNEKSYLEYLVVILILGYVIFIGTFINRKKNKIAAS